MKKLTNIVFTILMSILLIFNIPLYSNAAMTLEDIIDSGDSFLSITPADDSLDAVPDTINESELQDISNMISGILLTVAVAVTMISAVLMGISFTVQSVEDKAKIKESMVPWIIGMFISFGAYGIWKIAMNVLSTL